ncbi:MAG: type II toxin-antitoxin system VapB family antitoxin [Nocardioides sp.]
MRTTVTLNDDLVAKAIEMTGQTRTSSLLEESLRALIARESGRNLALLGGTDPDATPAPRHRGSAA